MASSLLKRFYEKKKKIERQVFTAWIPHRGQIAVLWLLLEAWAKGVFLRCGRKFGKTELAIVFLYIKAMLFDNGENYYIVDEREHAKDICWNNNRLPYFFTTLSKRIGESERDFTKRRRMGERIQHEWLAKDPSSSDMMVRLKNGSFLKVDGAKNYSRADGLRPQTLVYDEFKNHDRRYDKAARPNLDVFGGQLLGIGTPPNDFENYYCDVEKEFKILKDHYPLWAPSWINDNIYPGGEKNPTLVEKKIVAEKTGTLHDWLREYAAMIVPDYEMRIFPMIEKERHVFPHQELKERIIANYHDCEFWWGIDPGTTTVFGAIQIVINIKTKDVYLMNEIYKTSQAESATSVVWPEIVANIREWGPPIEDWGLVYDCAAAWFSNEVFTSQPESEAWGNPAQREITLAPCSKQAQDKSVMISVIKTLLHEGRMFISERCPNAYIEMLKYEKATTGRIPKGNDHLIDSIRYVLKAAGYSTEEYKERKMEHKVERLEDAVREILGDNAMEHFAGRRF